MLGLTRAAIHSWRIIRAKLAMGGISSPLQLPSLHALLDIVEQLAVEAKITEGGNALQKFYFELYKPDETEIKKLREEEDTDTGFDAAMAMIG